MRGRDVMKKSFFWVWILGLLFSSSAHADVYNRALGPLGEKEASMGNAGTAGDDSTGAFYYNPAGLVHVDGARMALTMTTFAYQQISADTLARIDNTNLPF